MVTAILILLGDLALGAMALKLGKSNEKVIIAIQETQATMQLLLSHHSDRFDRQDDRIAALEKAA